MDPQIRAPHSPTTIRSLTPAMAEPLMSRDFDSRPTLVYERLRHRYGSVAPIDLLGVRAWLVLGYSEVLEVLRNSQGLWSKCPDDWRALREGRVPAGWPMLPMYGPEGRIMQLEGGQLIEMREAWAAGVRPFQDRSQPQARRLEADVRRYADELISLMAEGGQSGWADLSAQYARPLMLMVINELIGFGAGTEDALMDMWRIMDAGPGTPEALGRLMGMLSDLIAAKQRQPGDDLPSYMLAVRPEFTVAELTGTMVLLLGMLGDFSSALICNTVVEVMTGNVAARTSLADGLIRETVNRAAMANPPLTNTAFRFATADTMLGGTAIAAGDAVALSIAAAHADPLFADALNRSSVHSSRAHLTWGAGPHQCLGDELATTLVTIAVERLFERMAGLELALPADQLPWRSSPMMRGLRSLPVRFQLRRPAAQAPAPAGSGEPVAAAEPAAQAPSRSALSRLVRALLRNRS